MALKALMLRKRLNDAQKALDTLRAKDADFETRKADIEKAIEEADTEEERAAVEEAIAYMLKYDSIGGNNSHDIERYYSLIRFVQIIILFT